MGLVKIVVYPVAKGRVYSHKIVHIKMQTLEWRFENPKLMVESILRQLRKLPNLRDDNSKLITGSAAFFNLVAGL